MITRHCTVFVTTAALAGVATVSTPILRAAIDYACRIEPSGNASGPSADVCEQVSRRWRLLTGVTPTAGEIHLIAHGALRSMDTGGYWTLEWPAPAATSSATRQRKRDGLPAHVAENILPHEAGHHVFRAYLGLASKDVTEYGTPAPDWIDEAAAVWMESRVAREQRMRAVARTTPSLAKVVLMEHPGRAQMQHDLIDAGASNVERTVTPPCPRCASLPEPMRTKYRIVTTTIGLDGGKRMVVSYADADPNAGAAVEQQHFYPLAYSLLRFIRMRGGIAAVRDLLGRYRNNPVPRVDVLLGLPGLPNSVATFEAEWRQFLRNPPPEDP